MDLADDFAAALEAFDLAHLENYGSSVCAIRADFTLAYRNTAWREFAMANGGAKVLERWPLGANLLDAIPSPIHAYFRDQLSAARETGSVWTHLYECSSPSLHRRFRLSAYPVADGTGLLLVHTRIVEEPHAQPGHEPSPSKYIDEHGLAYQCMHCRCFRTVRDEQRWDFVPSWVQSPPKDVSHGLCGVCYAHYFPE